MPDGVGVLPLTWYSTLTSDACAAESVTGMLTFVTLSNPEELGVVNAMVVGAVSLSVTYILALLPAGVPPPARARVTRHAPFKGATQTKRMGILFPVALLARDQLVCVS